MTLALIGLGTAVPDLAIPQPDAKAIAVALCCRTPEQATWVPAMYDGSGITTRYMAFPDAVLRDVLDGTYYTGSPFLPTGEPDDQGPTTGERMRHYAETAPPLAVTAAGRALVQSGLDPRTLTHLITVSCTGFLAPGVDLALIEGLGLAPTILRTHVGYMGCHGALNGLRVATAFAGADPTARVLLCAVELCSVHYHYGWDPQKVVANALFADGAAALVAIGGEAPGDAWRVAGSGSCLVPNSADAMRWSVGDHGFEMTLSRRVPDLICKHLRPWLESWLATVGLTLADIQSWAVHPGGPRILTAVEESLALPPEALGPSRAVLAECGNMSSPTLLFILDRLRRQNAPRPCVALGFGPGLAAEGVLFR
jgi:predicted naringenin-chalcone synthase